MRAGSSESSVAGKQAVRVLWGRAGLEQIIADRSRLATTLDAERLDNFLDWHASYMDACADQPDDVCFCVVSQGDRTAAIIPFERSMRRAVGPEDSPRSEMANDVRMPTGDWIVTDGSDPDAYVPAVLEQLSRAAAAAMALHPHGQRAGGQRVRDGDRRTSGFQPLARPA